MRIKQSEIDNLVAQINGSMGIWVTERPIGGDWEIGSYVIDYVGLNQIVNVSGGCRTVIQWGVDCPKSVQRMVLCAFLQGVTAERLHANRIVGA